MRALRGDEGLRRVATWLQCDHVSRWWGPPAQALAELEARDGDSAALIVVSGRPVGLVCWQVPSAAELCTAGLSDLPAGLIDIDIMIGGSDALGRGVGPAALLCLFDRLRSRGVEHVGPTTAVANTPAIAASARAGLLPWRDFGQNGERYRYFTRRLDAVACCCTVADPTAGRKP